MRPRAGEAKGERTGRVVGIGAFCDFNAPVRPRSLSCSIIEFVELDDGSTVNIDERGFNSSLHTTGAPDADLVLVDTEESMRTRVLNTVLPDDDADPDDHPWEWLATCARHQGVTVSAEDLSALDYQVVFSDRIHAWLAGSSGV